VDFDVHGHEISFLQENVGFAVPYLFWSFPKIVLGDGGFVTVFGWE